MKKVVLAGALSLLLLPGIVLAGPGSVTGTVRLAPRPGLTTMGMANGDTGFGVPLTGKQEKISRDTKLHLISQNVDMSRLSADEIEKWYKQGETPAGQPIFITTAKEDGSYEFANVPPGQYYLIIVAGQMDPVGNNNVTRTALGEKLSKYLPNWDQFVVFNIGLNSAMVHEVSVADDASTSFNYDFGVSAFSNK